MYELRGNIVGMQEKKNVGIEEETAKV